MRVTYLSVLFLTLFGDIAAHAQTNLRGWHANGQTWLVWTDNQTFTNAETYNIHSASALITNLASVPLIGRLFPADWNGTRLKRAGASLRWTIPNGAGGTYTLASNEAMFVYTPHTAAAEYFAVVKSGSTAVAAGVNSLAASITQTLAPVTCHVQNSATDAASGQTFRDYAFWLDGRADYTANRADFPVMGNENLNGVACLFRVFDPPGGVRAEPMPAVLVMHGHGSSWVSGGPTPSATYMNRHLDDGLVVNLDDHQFSYDATNVTGDGPGVVDSETRWFGYATIFDRFSDAPRTNLPNGSLVVPYTLRRDAWLVDWLVANRNADAHRIALMGHSMGGAGVSLNVRYAPEKYCAALAFEGPTVPTNNDLGNYMQGTQAQNLPTAQLGGLGVTQAYSPVNALSTNELPPLNFLWGVNDPTVVWSGKATVIANLDATRRGARLWWDERVHSPPWAGHWVGSTRLTAQHLVSFRNDQSFPAFSAEANADSDPAVAVPGSSTAKNWGVKNGYEDWDRTTVSDTAAYWACSLFLTGASTFTNDVPIFASTTASVTIRRAQRFRPAPATALSWRLRRMSDGAILQSNTTAPDANGLITVNALTIFKDPIRTRLEIYPTAQPPALGLGTSPSVTSTTLAQLAGFALATSGPNVGKPILNVNGLAGLAVIVESSDDLALWRPLVTATLTGPVDFVDMTTPLPARRFYRLRLP